MKWALACTLVAAMAAVAEDTPVFKAGFAQVDITPADHVVLWGYGKENRPDPMSTGVHDPLFAKAIVFETGDTRLAVVGMDLGRGPTEAMIAAIESALAKDGIGHVMISGSHTHHAPVIEYQNAPGYGADVFQSNIVYTAELQDKLIDVIRKAAGALEPAHIGWATGTTKINRNRHTQYEPKPRDPQLLVVAIEHLDGKPIAHIVNMAAHPTLMPPQVCEISADFPGVMMNEVESALGTHCVFIQGAAGDMQCDIDDSLWGTATFIEEVGHKLAKEVLDTAASIETAAPTSPSIVFETETFDFATRLDYANPLVAAAFTQQYGAELVACFLETVEGNRIHPVLNTAIVNGDLILIGVSGEFFSNHAVRLRERVRNGQVLFQGYCNGHHMYFPTVEAAAEGGYGAGPAVNCAQVGAGETMMNRALETIYTLQDDFAAQ